MCWGNPPPLRVLCPWEGDASVDKVYKSEDLQCLLNASRKATSIALYAWNSFPKELPTLLNQEGLRLAVVI